jgi:hypothetical protein
MAWLAFATGANGLGLYAWDDRVRDEKTNAFKGWHTREHPAQIEDLRAVLQEIRAHETILLSPMAAQQPAPMGNPALHAFVRESNGKRWMIAANDSRRPEEALLDLHTAPPATARSRTDGAADLLFNDGRTTLKLPPLGIGVYELQ